MTRFIPAEAAEPLSAALWRLSDPHGVGQTHDMFGWIESRLDGTRWLEVQTAYTASVHPDAILDGIADILQPWIDQGHLPDDTNANLAALVESSRGDSMIVYNAFPQLFKDMSKDRDEMIALGHILQSPIAN